MITMQGCSCAVRKAADSFEMVVAKIREMVGRGALVLGRIRHDATFPVHLAGKCRRIFLVHRRKGYVQRQMMDREGACNHCGACCHLLFTCPAASRDGGCLIHGVCQPQVCRIFPLDQRHLDEVRMSGGQCGYRFRHSTGPGAIPVIELGAGD